VEPAAASGPRWLFLLRPRWLGWHVFAILAAAGMLWLGDWQFRRAMAGNELSWAYTFEWPIFAVLGAVFWAKTIRDELRAPESASQEAAEADVPTGAGAVPAGQPGRPDAGDASAPAATAYAARLSAEVRGHGRWHGLR
jgi:hypothetical protein